MRFGSKNRDTHSCFLAGGFGIAIIACRLAGFWMTPAWSAEPIDFNRDIRPLLSNRCLRCHGPDPNERQGGNGGLRLDVETEALQDLGGYAAIVPGNPDESELYARITAEDADQRMPPSEAGSALSEPEVARIRMWIEQGAPYSAHWSYIPPRRLELPVVRDATWPRNGIDSFILRRLERAGLFPSANADRYALARRLSLDVTGLPPTIDQVERFVQDCRPDAYERYVDRLLSSETYGEHWARMWLDLARYADSAGYADDPPRTIWAYRDYVIGALNANKRFDEFTIEQIAGDLLPAPTRQQLIATAFHRNTLTNNEGGTNDEEFRNVAIVDRVNTTMAVWMGTTIACAQCHTHKYDPLTQNEYFQLFAIFNNTEDADRGDESPIISLYTDDQRQQRAQVEQEIAALESQSPSTAEEKERLAAQLEDRKKQLSEIKPPTTVPVMREVTDERRETRVQRRGNYLDTGDEVGPGIPAVFQEITGENPRDRLALARWLVSEQNPLTARVIANRYWEQVFGIGLVRTSEEFGSQGELPSHPELLDWLATELVRSGWNLKHLVRLLVTSAAYRQSSLCTPELLARDPENRLLARGPRFRMSAEMVRDQALHVSGLLSGKMYGPPARPPQPVLGVNAAFGGGIDWKASEGEDRYRRGLYTTWRRSNPYPSMAVFDAPNREVCTVRRARTNTPLQALVTLNDPVYVEAAQALARRIVDHSPETGERARFGFRCCLARPPSDVELGRLIQLYREARRGFDADAAGAERLATEPLGALPERMNAADLAAWTVVGNVLLNLDEMMMKR